jgi:putative hemolysin
MIWLLIVLFCLVTFTFSGIEAGIFSVNRVRLAHHARLNEPAALKLQQLLDRLLITVLMVTNFANISAFLLLVGELVAHFGNHGYWMALVIGLPIYLLVLELLPKSLFRRFPYRALAALAEPLRIIDWILTPVHLLGGLVQRLLFRGGPVMQQRMYLGREDFKYFAAEGEKTGTLTKAESEMISSVVDFRGVTAKDVMTPLDRARTLSTDAPVSELLERSAVENHDRWLIRGENGTITGVVSAFEVLLERRRDVTVGVYQRRIVLVGPNEPAYSVLRKLRAARSTIAAVRGPGSQPLGVLTWGDLIRKLVAVVQAPDRQRPA